MSNTLNGLLTYSKGEVQPGRRCMLRGFRLHKCPYWIRPSITISDHNGILFTIKKHPKTKDLMPEDFCISAPKKGIVVFALPGEPGLTEVAGDFKIYFNDGQGDFYCWLNTTMTENRKILDSSDLDGFDKRKIPAPGFQVEVVTAPYLLGQKPILPAKDLVVTQAMSPPQMRRMLLIQERVRFLQMGMMMCSQIGKERRPKIQRAGNLKLHLMPLLQTMLEP